MEDYATKREQFGRFSAFQPLDMTEALYYAQQLDFDTESENDNDSNKDSEDSNNNSGSDRDSDSNKASEDSNSDSNSNSNINSNLNSNSNSNKNSNRNRDSDNDDYKHDVEGEGEEQREAEQAYMYAVFPQLQPQHLSSIAPSMSHLATAQSSAPRMSLWMASVNASARLHYDMDDNFVLQLQGHKTMLLASPEIHALLQPHSSLHPLWRHSQLCGLSDRAGIVDLLQRHEANILNTKEGTDEEEEEEEKEGVGKKKEGKGKRSSKKKKNKKKLFAHPVGLWEVSLAPGDLLFVPAGHYHAVLHGSDSVSVNAWFSSGEHLYTSINFFTLLYTALFASLPLNLLFTLLPNYFLSLYSSIPLFLFSSIPLFLYSSIPLFTSSQSTTLLIYYSSSRRHVGDDTSTLLS
jgi:hypothetical protein